MGNSMQSTAVFVIALVIYAIAGSYMNTKTLIALSILLVFGALEINRHNGQNFLSTIGVGS